MGYTKEQRQSKVKPVSVTTITPEDMSKSYEEKTKGSPVETKVMRTPEVTIEKAKQPKPGWCSFQAITRCYVEGAQLEHEQTIELSPFASFKERDNHCLKLITGSIPEELSVEEVAELETGDPRVGRATKEFNLVKPG